MGCLESGPVGTYALAMGRQWYAVLYTYHSESGLEVGDRQVREVERSASFRNIDKTSALSIQ